MNRKPVKKHRPSRAKSKRSTVVQSTEIKRLEKELAATREFLQSLVENQQAMNEELKSANAEILSSNEQLQNIKAALQTARKRQHNWSP